MPLSFEIFDDFVNVRCFQTNVKFIKNDWIDKALNENTKKEFGPIVEKMYLRLKKIPRVGNIFINEYGVDVELTRDRRYRREYNYEPIIAIVRDAAEQLYNEQNNEPRTGARIHRKQKRQDRKAH